jgi:beta-1,4-mannosyl-glycoprotein beta-1,4-N-acetylglucosaminyltransferase
MLIDGFMFYNELDVLELRLTVLDKYVDRFILVESEVNHIGGSKELFFQKNRERYAKWLHKIVHIVVTAEESPKDTNPWSREKYQRECILRGLLVTVCTDGTFQGPVPDESIIMISDVDEIPNMAVVPFENLPHLISSIHMWMYHYSFDYLFTGEPWFGTVITTVEIVKKWGPNALRDSRWKFPAHQFSGWHLSSFGDEKHVLNKMRTFAHALDKNEHKHLQTEENIKKWIQEGKFIDGKTELVKRPLEAPLPAPVEVLRRLKLGTFP